MAGVELVVNNSDNPDPVAAGGTVSYTVRVNNDSTTNTAATGVKTVHAVSSGAIYQGTQDLAGGPVVCSGMTVGQAGPGVLTCTLPNLAATTEVEFAIRLKSVTAGSMSLGATASSDQVDDDSANNTANESTTVNAGANVAIGLTPAAVTVPSGSSVSLQLSVSNAGPDAATNLVVSTPVPTGFNVTALPAGCTNSGGVVTCNVAGPIAAGATATVGNLVGQIIAAGGSTVTGTATVAVSPSAPFGTPQDPDTNDNTAVANITVTPGSDLAISKSRSVAGNLLIGQTFNFILRPSYSGGSPDTITVTDAVPSNYTIGVVPVSQNGWSCSVAGQIVTCTRPSGGAVGLNQQLGDISIPVTVASVGFATNSATINAVTPDPVPGNNTATDGGVTLLEPTVDLGVSKTGPNPGLVVSGVPFNYTLRASNTGTAAYYGTITLTDNLPAGLTYNSASGSGWTCPAGPIVGPANIPCTYTYTAGTPLGVNGSTPALILNATASTTGLLTNSVGITATCNLGAGKCGDGDTATYPVSSSISSDSADISLIKTVVGPNPVFSGEVLSYKLEVVNAGPSTSANVVLRDSLRDLINTATGATGAGYVGHTISAGLATGATCTNSAAGNGQDLVCNFASIPVCTAGSNCPVVTLEIRPGKDGNRPNTAIVVSNGTADPDHSNEEKTVNSIVTPRADVTVDKTASSPTIAAGQLLTYVITASNINNGMSAADNVTITDTLPLNVTFVSATPSAGSCTTQPALNSTTTAGNNSLICNLGSIDNGSQQTVSVVVRPNTTTRGSSITNNVAVATSTNEPNTTNNTKAVSVAISNPSLDLVLNKVDTIDPVAVGDMTAYTITVTNSGPSAAENVVVNDPLPTTGQVSFQSATSSVGTCPTQPAVDAIGGMVSCNLGYMPAGATQTVTINVKGVQRGVYNNVANVVSDELSFEVNTSNNSAPQTTTVRTKADMEVVSKTPSAAVVNVRDNFDFVVKVRNNAVPGNEAEEVEVADTLPAGMQLTGVPTVAVISGTTTSTACTGAAGGTSFSCALGTVGIGAVIDITVPVQLVTVTSLPQTFTNTATVSTKSIDVVPGNNSNTGSVTVNSSTVSGRVFSDLNDDGLFTVGSDSGLAGVLITLTGTAFDGAAITRTATTDANGNYTFIGVPQGTYKITEGPVTALNFVDGKDIAGNLGGDVSVNDVISNIVLPANTAATGYNFAEIPVPLIGIAKSAGAVVNNLDGSYDVVFTLTVNNAGNTPLNLVQVNDTVAGQFGTYTAGVPGAGQYTITSGPTVSSQVNGAALSAVGAGVFTGSGAGNALLIPASSSLPNFGAAGVASRALIRFTVRFFPITPGPFENTATVTGTAPTNVVVTDNSVDGLVPDANNNGNPNDDTSPTIVNLSGQAIGVAKSVAGVVQTGSKRYRIPYTIIVQNVSPSVTATNVQVSDSLNATFPTAQTITISAAPVVSACTGTVLTLASPAFTGIGQNNLLAGNQNLQAGEKCTITFSTEVDFGTNPLPAVVQNNQATATTAQTPGGTVIATDLSDNGTVPDPNGNGNANEAGENDPTPVSFAAGGLSAISGTVYLDRNHDRVDNDGAPAPNVHGFIVEILNSEGKVVGSTTTAADGTYTISNLFPATPGDPTTYYTLQFREPVSGAVYGGVQSGDVPARNGVIVDGRITQLQLAPGITTVKQNLPLDPAGTIYDAISRNPIPGASVTLMNGGSAVPVACLASGINTQVTGATGMYQFLLNNPAPFGCPGSGTYTIQVTSPGGYLPPNSTLLPPVAGVRVPTIGGVDPIQAQSVPPTGVEPTTYYFDFNLTLTGDVATSSSNVVNNHIPLDPILGGAIVMSKSTPLVNVVRGDLVPYTITATNTLAATLGSINVVDVIPAGFRYRTGSATLNGVKLEPVVTGRNLVWPNQSFAPNERKTLRMLLVVGTGVAEGEYVNRVSAVNGIVNTQVSNTATATVRVVPDPTFDCSDIIGKIFDDKNANGYQDQGEPGIANVRIATARGLLVTTDQDGRFHVACAAIPNADRGSNFVMKVDERTLPSGYRLTTENPRDVRVTRGKMVKLNFGATVHRVVRLELSSSAFIGDGTELQAPYLAELNKLPEQLATRPTVLRIAYRQGKESKDLANKRIAAVNDHMQRLWQDKRKDRHNDSHKESEPLVPLMIETELEAAQ
ncbi:Cna protein B-type domain protein [compost metagenome]